MAFYTQHNLKIRLDEDRLYPVVLPLKIHQQMDDVMMDLELWENFPNSVSTVTALGIAYLTQAVDQTIVYAVLAFFIGLLIQEMFYSNILKSIFPMFIGGWMIALPATIGVCLFLVKQGQMFTAVITGLIFAVNWLNATSILMFLWFPVSAFFVRRTGLGAVERSFISICNQHAKRLGITLKWELYDRQTGDETV